MYQSLAKRVIITILFLFIYIRSTLATKVPLKYAGSNRYVGQSVGSGKYRGECAAGVQTVFHDYYKKWILGKTKTWRNGTKVFGNKIPAGTAIASFDSHGKYNCKYGCHAAIYVSQNKNGVLVYDQWTDQKWHQRTLHIKTKNKPQSNQADRFSILLHN